MNLFEKLTDVIELFFDESALKDINITNDEIVHSAQLDSLGDEVINGKRKRKRYQPKNKNLWTY